MEKSGIETEYTFLAMFSVLFHFGSMFGCKDTNMEVLLSEHPM